MKTVEEFYKEISDSKELQEELKNASDEMLEEFLKKHGCNVSAKEFTEFVISQNEGAIEDDDAAAAAGGAPMYGFRTPKGASGQGGGFVDCIKAFF